MALLYWDILHRNSLLILKPEWSRTFIILLKKNSPSARHQSLHLQIKDIFLMPQHSYRIKTTTESKQKTQDVIEGIVLKSFQRHSHFICFKISLKHFLMSFHRQLGAGAKHTFSPSSDEHHWGDMRSTELLFFRTESLLPFHFWQAASPTVRHLGL